MQYSTVLHSTALYCTDTVFKGNCQTVDNSGGKWCFVDPQFNSCHDLRFSTRYPTKPWSYEACTTPRAMDQLPRFAFAPPHSVNVATTVRTTPKDLISSLKFVGPAEGPQVFERLVKYTTPSFLTPVTASPTTTESQTILTTNTTSTTTIAGEWAGWGLWDYKFSFQNVNLFLVRLDCKLKVF